MIGFVPIVAIFLGSLVFTRLTIMYAVRRCLLDVPNERSLHEVSIPRGGGLSIVIMFIIGVIVLHWLSFVSSSESLSLLVGGAMVAAVGFWDDHCDVSPLWRILVHLSSSLFALLLLGGFPAFNAGPAVYTVPLNIFWVVTLVWFLNSYNFMDGVDGIAGAEAVFIAGTAGLLLLWDGVHGEAMAMLILMFAVAGFLVWNWPPAKIFMGDVGSGFLGFIIGVLAIMSVKHGSLNIWVWVILAGVFVTDAAVTMFRRMFRGARWYEAHCSHAYQHAFRRFRSHGKVTGAMTCINVFWLFPLAVAAWRWPAIGLFGALMAYVPLIWLTFKFEAGLDPPIYNRVDM